MGAAGAARGGIALIVVAGSLALASTAEAAEIGGDIGAAGSGQFACLDQTEPCVFVQFEPGSPAEIPAGGGVITSWRTRNAVGDLALRVFRGDALVGASGFQTHPGTDTPSPAHPVRIPVQEGDLIGAALDAGAGIGVFSDSSASLFEGTDANPTVGLAAATENRMLLAANVEPDADGDNFGDDTQDGCPTDAARQGACATPPPPPPPPDPLAALKAGALPALTVAGKTFTATKKGTIGIRVTNPASGYGVSGAVTLKAGKKKAGAAKYALAPSGVKTVTVKLSKAARRALKRRRKVKAVATVTVKGPVGRTATIKRKLTIKPAPKKVKPKAGGPLYIGKSVRFNLTRGKVTGFTGTTGEFLCHGSRGNVYFEAPITFTDKDAVAPAAGKFRGNGVGIDQRLNDGEPKGGRIYRYAYTGTLKPGATASGTFTVTYDYRRARLNSNGLGGYLDHVFCEQTLVWTAK